MRRMEIALTVAACRRGPVGRRGQASRIRQVPMTATGKIRKLTLRQRFAEPVPPTGSLVQMA
jgi:hypothetical protein